MLDFIQFERSLGIQHFNTVNLAHQFPKAVEKTKNNKIGKITKDQEDVFAEYQATARTTLRFAWFTDFTGFMCK